MKLLLATIFVLFSTLTHATKDDSVFLYNVKQNRVEMSRNPDQIRSIASITKLMTAMVTLDYDKDLSRRLMLSRSVHSHLPRQQYTREQLLNAMLVKSDNAAAETLANDYPGGRSAFIAAMNQQAREWGMKNTRFEDPTGLSANNISTASEVASMMEVSAGYWIIQEVTTRKQVAVEAQFKKRVRTVNLKNTNSPLLFEFDNIVVSKTGFTSRAGFCLGLVVDQKQQQYIIVVLGAKTKQDRIRTVEKVMYNHVIDNQLPEMELTPNL